MFNNGFVTGLLWSAGAGVVIGNVLNNGFVTGRFKRLPLLCFQYMPEDNKGSLYRGASLSLWWYTYYIISGFVGCLGLRRLLYRLVGVALHMPQDNKRFALSWGEPFFVVVHLLYNKRFRGLV